MGREYVYDIVDQTDTQILFHIHREGEEGHYYWIYKEPLNVTFTSEGVVENAER